MSLLVISNNKVSRIRNNGKTIASLFGHVKVSEFYQLSIHSDEYDLDIGKQSLFLSISGLKVGSSNIHIDDNTTLNDMLSEKAVKKPEQPFKRKSFFNKVFGFLSKKNLFTLLVRDFIFIPSYLMSFHKLKKFIAENKIDKVFFVYPDFLSFQFFVFSLISKCNVSFDVYFTDDYLLSFDVKSESVTKRNGYNFLLNLFVRRLMSISKNTFCIGDKMSSTYLKFFGFESKVLINVNSLNPSENLSFVQNDTSVISYFGSLHTGRMESLHDLCNIIQDYNDKSSSHRFLVYLYANAEPGVFRCFDFLLFKEPVSGSDYEYEILNSDILLLVEGTDVESIKSTWLSCSTKVPEYLSSRKPILAHGSRFNGSVQLLTENDLAFSLNVKNDSLADLLDLPRVNSTINSAYKFYQDNFSKSVILKRLEDE